LRTKKSAEVMTKRVQRTFGFAPFPVAPTVCGTSSPGLVGPEAAWSLVLAVLFVCCGLLWTLGTLRGTPGDDDAASSFADAVEKEAA
jgi:hypothetical protein